MGVKTKDEYIESIRQLKPTAYMAGEKITDIVDNPRLRPGIEATGATYELAQMDEYRDLMLTHSPLIDEPVSRLPCRRVPSKIWWPGSKSIAPSATGWAPAISVAPAWTVCQRFPSSPMTSIKSTTQTILNALPDF